MIAARRLWWPDVLVVALSGFLAVRYTRNVGFFVPALVPMCGHYLQLALQRPRLSRFRAPVAVLAAALGCAFMATSAAALLHRGAPLQSEVGKDFPVAAADFLERHGVSGRVMNEYDWGGYLLWRLRPRSQVFIDGRILAPARVTDYARMLWGVVDEQRGARVYRELLDASGIEVAVLRPFMLLGNLPPLTLRLLEDPEWVPAYADRQAVVLLRRSALARSVPGTALSREEFVGRLLRALDTLSTEAPDDPRPHLARAELFEWLGQPEEARRLTARAFQLAPENPFVQALAARLGR